MTKIVVTNGAELSEAFCSLGANVGPRRGINRRTKDQKEWYCLRRYLLTLAAHNLLSYPLDLSKSERPDFIVTDGTRDRYGIEVTEATEQDWQRELTETEAGQGDDPAEAIPIGEDGFAGEQPEHDWCAVVIHAISNKITSLSDPNYPVGLCDLLIYVNSRMSVVAHERRAIELLTAVSLPEVKGWKECARLGRAVILANRHVLPDLLSSSVALPISADVERTALDQS